MICNNCGFDVGQNRFCTNCGAEIVAAEQTQSNYSQDPGYNTQQNNYNQAPAYDAQQNNYNQAPAYDAQQNNYNQAPAYDAQQNAYNPNPGYGAPQNNYNPNPGYGAPGYGAPGYGVPFAPAEDFNLISAYKSFWKKYADFSGRSRRKEYWLATLAQAIITFILTMIWTIVFYSIGISVQATSGDLSGGVAVFAILLTIVVVLYGLATIIPSISMMVRRLHDSGKSGWLCFLSLIPYVGSFIMLAFACMDSQPGMNQYGPNPKGY